MSNHPGISRCRPLIEYVDFTNRLVVIEGGETLPIAALIDSDGDETDVSAEAVVLVFGTDQRGWFTFGPFDLPRLVFH